MKKRVHINQHVIKRNAKTGESSGEKQSDE